MVEDEGGVLKVEENSDDKGSRPDPLRQLIQCFQRAATSEESQAISIANDKLYIDYADVMAKSVHIEDDDDDGGNDEGEINQAEKEEPFELSRQF